MRRQPRKISIVSEFVIIGTLFFTIILVLCGWFISQTISFYKNEVSQQLEFQAERLERSFIDSIDQTIYMMQVLISQIRYQYNDLAVIENTFSRFKIHSQIENLLTWTAFSWVNEDFKLTVDMLHGILNEPIDMTHRDYIHFTKKRPDHVYFGKPTYGSTSKVWMIPAGIGVADHKNNYIGSIVIGFSIGSFLEKLKIAAASEEIGFALIDKDLNVILQSRPNLEGISKEGLVTSSYLTELLKTIDFSSQQPYTLSNVSYRQYNKNYYIHKINKYPFLFYLIYDKKLINIRLWKGLVFRIAEITTVGLIVLLLLILLYRQIVKPLVILSKIVDEIPKRIYVTKAPRSCVYEISILTKQTLTLKRVLSREIRDKTKLLATAEIAINSDKAKETFSQQIIRNSWKLLYTIRLSVELLIADLLEEGLDKKLPAEDKLALLKEARRASLNIIEKIDDRLEAELIDVEHLLSECIIIHSKTAHINGTNVCSSMKNHIPKWPIDKLKFKQIILALLKRSLGFCPKNSSIEIELAVIQGHEKINELQIIIRDDGFGLDSDYREEILEEKENTSYDHLNTKVIRKLVELHKGKIDFIDTIGKGSEVRLLFPYIETRDLQKSEKKKEDQSTIH